MYELNYLHSEKRLVSTATDTREKSREQSHNLVAIGSKISSLLPAARPRICISLSQSCVCPRQRDTMQIAWLKMFRARAGGGQQCK